MTLEELLGIFDRGEEAVEGTEAHDLLVRYSNEAMRITSQLNSTYHTPREIQLLMTELTGREVGPSFRLFPPFYTDFGKNIHLGAEIFINACCCFQDQGGIYIEDGVLIGHRVTLATLNHGIAPEKRHSLFPRPIHIQKNVWIGAGAIILPGVTIGENAVVAAGAVVGKNVAANTVVGGVPARFIKNVTDAAKS